MTFGNVGSVALCAIVGGLAVLPFLIALSDETQRKKSLWTNKSR